MEQMSMQKRLLLAALLSIVFFIVYDFFMPKRAPLEQNQTTISQTMDQSKAPASTNDTPKSNENLASNEIIATIKGQSYEAKIDKLGRIAKFYLTEDKYKTEDGNKIELVSQNPLPLELRFNDSTLNTDAFKVAYSSDASEVDASSEPKTIKLIQNLDGVTVTKNIKFYPNGRYEVEVNLSKSVDYFITPGFRPNIAIDSYTVHGVMLRNTDDSLNIIEDGDAKEVKNYANTTIAAASDRYYTALFYSFNKPFEAVVDKDANNNPIVFIKANDSLKLGAYIGPKEHKILSSMDERLNDVIEYGWFTFIAKPMFAFLNFLHNYIGNWGWAIVVLTLVIRIVLFPLTYKGMLSMNKLKELAPKVKEIQTKYKDDKQKMQVHMMELYKKHGANPMGGCLPILLQIPVFFAIYRVLLNAIELKGAPWILWIHDLSVMDPYFVLPILMGLTMFLQQKLTPTTFTDPMQEKVMKFLPLIFTFFFVTFPAGLTLYWFVNNVCSVVQQVFVNKLFEKHKKAAEVKAQ